MAYIERQLKAFASHPSRPGTLDHVCVQHDPWCPTLRDESFCICDPDMLLLTADGREFEIDRKGGSWSHVRAYDVIMSSVQPDRISVCPGCGSEIVAQRQTRVNISATKQPIWAPGVLSEYVGDQGECWKCSQKAKDR